MPGRQPIDDIIKKLSDFFARQDDIAVAYLFGSIARKRPLPSSDVDVGIVFQADSEIMRYGSSGASNTDSSDGKTALETAKAQLFRRVTIIDQLERRLTRRVDVVDLMTASPAFNHHVFRHKVILKGRHAPARIAFEKQVRRAYFDMLPYRERYIDASLRRLKEGASIDGRRRFSSSPLADARAIHKRLTERQKH